jgi:4-amino-4-deoxy-L-arabinose transferase-like glycosyltransferase
MTFPPLRAWPRSQWVMLAAAVLLVLLAMAVRPINRDEGQYVAATAMMRLGLPYADFAYLQTPLQPLLLSPLSVLPAGWLLVASRLANSAFALATIWLVGVAARDVAPRWAVMVSVGALLCTDPFLFTGALARNDALPMMLLGGAIVILAQNVESGGTPRRWLAAGLLLGLAVSAKINFALPASGAGLYLLLTARNRPWQALAAFVIGGVAGLVPTLAMALADPQRFWWGVFTYSLSAPQQWWALTGHSQTLTAPIKVWQLVQIAAWGAILPALLAALLDRRRNPVRLLLDLMILGALVGAYLPDPAFDQYLVPLLPPLFVRLALALGALRKPRRLVVALVIAGSLLGLSRTGHYLSRVFTREWQLGAAVEQARLTARLANGGSVVTISPERVAGSDVVLDRGFVTGPFLYRTEGPLAEQALRYGFSPNWRGLGAYLDANPPAAILTGGEPKPRPPIHRISLDAHLDQWARIKGYRAVPLPGRSTLYLRNHDEQCTDPACNSVLPLQYRLARGRGEFQYAQVFHGSRAGHLHARHCCRAKCVQPAAGRGGVRRPGKHHVDRPFAGRQPRRLHRPRFRGPERRAHRGPHDQAVGRVPEDGAGKRPAAAVHVRDQRSADLPLQLDRQSRQAARRVQAADRDQPRRIGDGAIGPKRVGP